MGQLERIIIVSDRAKDLDDYERYVTNKHGTLSPQIEPIGEVPIHRCADLDGVNRYLATSGFTVREEFEKRLKEVYDGVRNGGEPVRILVVDDDSWVCTYLEHSLPYQRYTVHNLDSGNQVLVLIRDSRRSIDTASDARNAFRLFKQGRYYALLTDLWMPDQAFRTKNLDDWDKTSILQRMNEEELHEGSQGITLIENVMDYLAQSSLALPLIIPFSSQWEHPRIRQLYADRIYRRCGVGILPKHYSFDYVHRSTFDDMLNSFLLTPELSTSLYNSFISILRFSIEEVRKRKRAINEFISAQNRLVGNSEKILGIINDVITMVAPTNYAVMLTGETGTGKELLAALIHEFSQRKNEPFLKFNCALGGELMESQLFGHEKGSFTGAHVRRIGLFEEVGAGTIFLDEIGDLKVDLQAKLLRVLEERSFRRVGGTEDIPFQARIVAALNRDPEIEIKQGRLREDLYYRLGSTFRFELPPLRDRKQDVALLAQHFIRRECQELGKPELYLGAEAEMMLVRFDWPGNVRQLEGAIRRAATFADEVILPKDLPPWIQGSNTEEGETNHSPKGRAKYYRQDLARFHREYLMDALAQTGNNVVDTAKLLQVSRGTVYKLMKTYNIQIESELHENNG